MTATASFHIVFEDVLSEAVISRLLREAPYPCQIVRRFTGQGSGYITSRIQSFLKIAQYYPVFVLIDSDSEDCALRLLDKIMPRETRRPGFFLRIAVHEIESWLLADPKGLSAFLGISESWVPKNPETVRDAKEFLVDLARRSNREIARAIVPKAGVSARQGVGYNDALSLFVERTWNPTNAALRSESLRRAIKAVESYTP